MLDLLSTQNVLHTRLVEFTLQEYFFVLQVVLGERMEVAYANTYDVAEFKRNVPSEEEDEYLATKAKEAEDMLGTQECRQLYDELNSAYRSAVQSAASSLEEFHFTSEDVQKLLANLLHERTQDLSETSIRDLLSLIKTMYDNGSLDSGDNFQRHFITIPKKYDCMCTNCNREMYAVEGIDIKCPSCGQVYKWANERFYPQPQSL